MGCTSSKKEIKQVVEHWMGKEIVFPSNLTTKIYGKDTFGTKSGRRLGEHDGKQRP